MESSVTQKKCNACLNVFPLSNFYTKGKYWDSLCKPCLKKKKRARYKAKDGSDIEDRLVAFADLLYGWEITEINKLYGFFKKIVQRVQSGEVIEGLDPPCLEMLEIQFKAKAFAELSLGVITQDIYSERLKSITEVFEPK